MTYKFGDVLENAAASDRNPTKRGFFVRYGYRPHGRMNPGRFIILTDGRGHFWEMSANCNCLTKVADSQISLSALDAVHKTTAAMADKQGAPA